MSQIMSLTQFLFTIVIGMYFLMQITANRYDKDALDKESRGELQKLHDMRGIRLTEPLTEKTRPAAMEEIIGQEDGLRALMIALGGKNPQHVLIYGPPGVGKTAASRVALEWAKKTRDTPFRTNAPFVEVDAATMQYDERCIADPLIGSVHDPIYQGAGAYGNVGAPQIKEGAVTRANGGILFIDEIGELPAMQLNRLLKVLEDRRVTFESSYYSKNNKHIPRHVHDVFEKGLPADFRLIGATTRKPEEIPEAVRSRCVEVFFDGLCVYDLEKIMKNAAVKAGIQIEDEVIRHLCTYISNGRDGVKLISMLAAKAELEGKTAVTLEDAMWVLKAGHYSRKMMVIHDTKPAKYETA